MFHPQAQRPVAQAGRQRLERRVHVAERGVAAGGGISSANSMLALGGAGR